jgi:hypothetical protein
MFGLDIQAVEVCSKNQGFIKYTASVKASTTPQCTLTLGLWQNRSGSFLSQRGVGVLFEGLSPDACARGRGCQTNPDQRGGK